MTAMLWLLSLAALCSAVPMSSALSVAKACDGAQVQDTQAQVSKCMEKFTQKHHEAFGKAKSQQEAQLHTCQMLRDTMTCDDMWARCHSPDEIRAIKDRHIEARMQQFGGDPRHDDGDRTVRLNECDVVKEYVSSGRANAKAAEGEACTQAEQSQESSDYAACRDVVTNDVWQRAKDVEYEKESALRLTKPSGTLDPADIARDVKPLYCKALLDAKFKCASKFIKCYSREDAEQMAEMRLTQIREYFSSMYRGMMDLTNCPGISSDSPDVLPGAEDEGDQSQSEDEYEEEDAYEDPHEKHGGHGSRYDDGDDDEDLDDYAAPKAPDNAIKVQPGIDDDDDDDDDSFVLRDYDGETNDISGPKSTRESPSGPSSPSSSSTSTTPRAESSNSARVEGQVSSAAASMSYPLPTIMCLVMARTLAPMLAR